MKILITNHHLRNKAGSELFTFELAVNLKRMGHDVFVFSFDLGEIAERIKKNGILITSNLIDFKNEKFDIIHAQHSLTAIVARSVFPKTPMIFMSHGALPELEQAPSINLGISKFIAVSEEVKNNLINNCNVAEKDIEVVRNFVDTERFYSTKKINKVPKKLLVLSNHYSDDVRSIIEKACGDLNIMIEHIGLPENPVEDVEKYINEADIVVTLGRGALEAMACERNVIVYDIHGSDGFVDENSFYEIRKNNFSGRRYSKNLSVEDFKCEISKYDQELGIKMRKIIKEENELQVVLNNIEKNYKKVIKRPVLDSQINEGQLQNEIMFLEKYFVNFQDSFFYIKNQNQIIQQKEQEIQQKEQEIQQKEQEIQQKEQEIQQKEQEIQQKEQEIIFMQLSKFWKLRNRYTKLKKFLKFNRD